jgi:hypothetical protein
MIVGHCIAGSPLISALKLIDLLAVRPAERRGHVLQAGSFAGNAVLTAAFCFGDAVCAASDVKSRSAVANPEVGRSKRRYFLPMRSRPLVCDDGHSGALGATVGVSA